MNLIKNAFGLFSKTVQTLNSSKNVSEEPSKGWLATKIEYIKSEYSRIREDVRDLKKTNLALALKHYNAGNASDARFRFKLLKCFVKDMKELDYYIGRTYFEEGLSKKAKKHLENYLSTGDTSFVDEAKYTIDFIDGNTDKIQAVPPNLVSHYYDLLASSYNDIFINDRVVCPQKEIYEKINKILVEIGQPFGHNVLDVGCGTGYVGAMFKSNKIAAIIDGVDISKNMVDLAKSLKTEGLQVYNEVHFGDAIEYMKNTQSDYSIIIASNFVGHYPKPEELFKLLHSKLKSGGLLALTFKVYEGEEQKMFNSKAEDFHFNGKYMLSLVTNDNWSVLETLPITFMEEEDTGLIIVQKK